MSKQKKLVANKPTGDKSGAKFDSFLGPAAKAGTFSQVSANTNGAKKKH